MSDKHAAQMAPAHPVWVQVYGKLGAAHNDGWEPIIAIPNEDLDFLRCSHVGWLLHTMFCVTGSLGSFERPVLADSGGKWIPCKNEDTVQTGMTLRYIADLDTRRFITYRELSPTTKTMSSSSTGLTGTSVSGSHDSTPEYPLDEKSVSGRPHAILGDFLQQYVSPSSLVKGHSDLRAALLRRDVTDVLIDSEHFGEAAHLVGAQNPFWILDVIAHTRGFAGGDSRKKWGSIKSLFDAPLGVLLWDTVQKGMDNAVMGLMRVPNFGMLDLDKPRPTSGSKEPPPKHARFPLPLSETALHLHNLLPEHEIMTWAGVKSTVYVIPLKRDALKPLNNLEMAPDCLLRVPTSEVQAEQWPFNALFDWAWGARVANVFGTVELKNASRMSDVSRAIEEYRQGLKKRARSGEDKERTSKKAKVESEQT